MKYLVRLLGVVLLCACLPAISFGTITFDAFTASSFGTISTITFNHTVGSGSDRILIVKTATRSETPTVTGITYNGVALTLIKADAISPVGIEMWRLVNPAAGTHSTVVTFSGAPSTWNAAIAVSFAGVDQTTPIDVAAQNATSTGTGVVTSTSITTVTDGAMVIDVIGGNSDAGAAPLAGQTADTAPTNSSIGGSTTDYIGGSYKILASHGSTTTQWSESPPAASAQMSLTVTALRPATGGATATTDRLLTGAGK